MILPTNTLLELSVMGTCNNQSLINVLHYANTNNPSQEASLDAHYQNIADYFWTSGTGKNNVKVYFETTLATNWSLVQLKLQFIHPVRYRAGTPTGMIGTGTATGQCTAQNIQASITKEGERSGKRYRGGIRIGGISSVGYTGGLITATLRTNLLSLGLQLMTIIAHPTSGVWAPVIKNKLGPAWQDPFQQWTRYTVHNEVRTQSTRTVGRGV